MGARERGTSTGARVRAALAQSASNGLPGALGTRSAPRGALFRTLVVWYGSRLIVIQASRPEREPD